MTAKPKNMLEAFRTADELSASMDQPVSVQAVPPPAREPRLTRSAQVEDERTPFPAWLGWIGALIVAFAGGVLVGRGDRAPEDAALELETATSDAGLRAAGIVHAADRPTSDRGRAGDPTAATSNSAPARSSEEPSVAALMDAANQYTVVVATYAATQENLAFATFGFLLDEGIPAFVPYRVGDKLVVLAGAAPKKGSLDSLRREIHALTHGGTRGIFDDAYTTSIDSLVDR